MIIYILTFFCCFAADYFRERSVLCYRVLVVWIYVFLCFGYMTGSDWRSYERMYDSDLLINQYQNTEFGFVYLVNICKLFISDFWVFNGLSKIFHLFTLTKLLGLFTDKKWTALGISFTYSTLFMLIDCPMRFMIGSSFLYLSFFYFMQKKKLPAIILAAISLSFHITLIIPVVIGLSTKISNWYSKISSFWMFVFLSLVYVVIAATGFYEMLYDVFLPMVHMDRFADSSTYSEYDVKGILSIGRLKELFLYSFFVLYKKRLLEVKYGDVMYYLATIAILLAPITSAIYTAFRLVIFPTYFVVLSFVALMTHPSFVCKFRPIIKYSFLLVFVFIIARNVTRTYKYLPYSNSIPYIFTHHLSFSERNSHNLVEYTKITGKPAK